VFFCNISRKARKAWFRKERKEKGEAKRFAPIAIFKLRFLRGVFRACSGQGCNKINLQDKIVVT
jgi:hypothetical protein